MNRRTFLSAVAAVPVAAMLPKPQGMAYSSGAVACSADIWQPGIDAIVRSIDFPAAVESTAVLNGDLLVVSGGHGYIIGKDGVPRNCDRLPPQRFDPARLPA